jgi:hypothetical protein
MSHFRDEQPVRNFRNGSAIITSGMAIAQDNNKAVMSFNVGRYMPIFKEGGPNATRADLLVQSHS